MNKILDRNGLAEMGKNRALMPGREQFKNDPGYYEREAKVWRTGVGFVDGYEWGCKIPANDGHGKLTKKAQELGEMIAPSVRAEDLRQAKLQGVTKRWEPRMRGRGTTLMRTCGGKLYRRTGEDSWEEV
jgi:hypothetical protein